MTLSFGSPNKVYTQCKVARPGNTRRKLTPHTRQEKTSPETKTEEKEKAVVMYGAERSTRAIIPETQHSLQRLVWKCQKKRRSSLSLPTPTPSPHPHNTQRLKKVTYIFFCFHACVEVTDSCHIGPPYRAL